MTSKRPRAKNFKTELLLREVERRSVPHIVQLSRDGWPSDPKDRALAISTVLELLKREPMPSRRRILRSSIGTSDWKDAIDVIRAATMTIVKPLIQRRGSQDVDILALRPLEGNVPTLIRWLDFMSRESAWLFNRWSFPQNHTNGPMFAAQCLQSIYTLATGVLRAEIDSCPQMVDLLLHLWNWRDPNGKTLHYRFLAEANGGTCPVLMTLSIMVKQPIALSCLTENIQAFSRLEHLRFIGSALDRLEEHAVLRLEPKPFMITNLLQVMEMLLELPESAVWYARCGFSPKILCVAKRFPHLRACGKYGGQLLPLPVAVTTYLFPLETLSVILSYRCLPELLDSGLLEILVDYLLSLPAGTPFPWYSWAGDHVKIHLGEPMPILFSMCVYRPILDALCNAKSRLPQEKLDRLNRAWYRDHWSVHLPTFALYKAMWQVQDNRKGLDLCDNLNHHNHERPQLVHAKECTHCRAVVYCSEECQREDWAMYHRLECSGSRQYRIARKKDADSVSHKYRAYLLALLHHAVFSYEVGVRSEVTIDWLPLDRGSKLTHDERIMPQSCNHHKARVEATRDAVVHFTTFECPTKFHLQPIQSISSISHGGRIMFHEDRFTTLFDEAQNAVSVPHVPASGPPHRIRLGLCSAFCGSFRIWVLGRFSVTRNENQHTMTVEKLNGYVKVEERMAIDMEHVSYVRDSMVETSVSPCESADCLCRESFVPPSS